MNYKEFKDKYSECPYCSGKNFDAWTHLIDGSALEFICKDCWGSDFGWQAKFKTKDNLIDDNAIFTWFRVWNGKYEAWFYVEGYSPYFENGEIGQDNFGVLILNQGPISDNPVAPRLKKKFIIKKELDLFLNKEYVLSWMDEQLK